MKHLNYPSICVFCGASPQADIRFQMLASDLGQALVKDHFNVVYGGGGRGLMGALARAALSANGYVQGVIPQFLIDLEVLIESEEESQRRNIVGPFNFSTNGSANS
jgi:predicted Rossmann-fold nucleotide-binding protein